MDLKRFKTFVAQHCTVVCTKTQKRSTRI